MLFSNMINYVRDTRYVKTIIIESFYQRYRMILMYYLLLILCCRKRIPKVNFQLKHLLILARNSKSYSTYQLRIH